MLPLVVDGPVSSVTCLGAHPDDIEIGAGGTLTSLARKHPDAVFRFVVLTSTPTRAAEAEASARQLLGERVTVHVGAFRDGYLPYQDPAGAKEFVMSSLGDGVPDIVVAPSRNDAHQDHQFVAGLAGQLLRDSLVLEYEIVKYDGDLGSPNIYMPLSADEVTSKIEHLRSAFPSQHGKPWYSDEAFRGLMKIRGIEAKAPEGYAEAFYGHKVVLG